MKEFVFVISLFLLIIYLLVKKNTFQLFLTKPLHFIYNKDYLCDYHISIVYHKIY